MLECVPAATDLDLITFLKAIPDARMQCGVRRPAWYFLLVVIQSILSRCQSLRDSAALCPPAHRVLTEAMDLRAHSQAGMAARKF